MTPSSQDTQAELDPQAAHATFPAFVQEQMRLAIRATFIDILEDAVTAFIGAERYARTTTPPDQRAAHRSRSLGTPVGVSEDLPVARTRSGFHSQLFDRYQPRMLEVDTLLRARFVGHVSQQSVGALVEQLPGTPASPSTVSRVLHTLEAEFAIGKSASCPPVMYTSLPMAATSA